MKRDKERKLLTRAEIDELLRLLTRSKAIWMVPDLLNLTESAENANHAYKLVFFKTNKRRKAIAARWYAIALRNFHPDLVSACAKWLKVTGKQNFEDLGNFLFNALGKK